MKSHEEQAEDDIEQFDLTEPMKQLKLNHEKIKITTSEAPVVMDDEQRAAVAKQAKMEKKEAKQ